MTFLKESISQLDYRNQLSADGRLRTSQQILQGDYKQHNDIAGGSFNTQTIGTGAFAYENSAIGATELQVTTNLDACIRQTYQWHNYFAGKPQKIELTASTFGAQTDVVKRFGYFSTDTTTPFDSSRDGMYFESSGGTLHCKIDRNGTNVFTLSQSSWLNQSELASYDPNDFNFYVIDFLYLGGAVVNFWVLTSSGLTLVAQYQHINVDANTFVKSPNQPVRYEIRSTGGAGTFNHICSDVVSEGFGEETGILKTINNDSALLSAPLVGTRYALIGIQQQSARRNVVVDLKDFTVLAGSADDLLVEIYFGGTTATATPWANVAFSNMEGYNGADLAGATDRVHSGGVKIFSTYLTGNSSVALPINTARRIGSYIDGTREAAFLCITPLTSNANVACAGNWIEFI